MDPSNTLHTIHGLIIDMDGVLWHGDKPLPGLVHFFEVLRQKHIQFVLATNNNTQSAQGFIDKLASFGVTIQPDEILTASIATLQHLKKTYPLGSRVYVVGEAPLKKLIGDAGYILAEQDVAVVVATMDRGLTYDMLKRATLLIRAGADFVAPNPDKSYPTAEGIVPGAGAVLAALVASTDHQPLIIGKPEKAIYEIAVQRMNLEPQTVASLGDRLDTDIEGGIRCGLKTILVLSGVTTREEAQTSPIKPDWIYTGIDTLTDALLIG
jgi:4-nitrophenyl phosphatase